MPPHPLTNFEIEEYLFEKKHFNGVYSRDNLPKTIKNGAYVINTFVLDSLILCLQVKV